jgi:hypothetical protein
MQNSIVITEIERETQLHPGGLTRYREVDVEIPFEEIKSIERLGTDRSWIAAPVMFLGLVAVGLIILASQPKATLDPKDN